MYDVRHRPLRRFNANLRQFPSLSHRRYKQKMVAGHVITDGSRGALHSLLRSWSPTTFKPDSVMEFDFNGSIARSAKSLYLSY